VKTAGWVRGDHTTTTRCLLFVFAFLIVALAVADGVLFILASSLLVDPPMFAPTPEPIKKFKYFQNPHNFRFPNHWIGSYASAHRVGVCRK
jgi:hypothetical protein